MAFQTLSITFFIFIFFHVFRELKKEISTEEQI